MAKGRRGKRSEHKFQQRVERGVEKRSQPTRGRAAGSTAPARAAGGRAAAGSPARTQERFVVIDSAVIRLDPAKLELIDDADM